MAKRVSPAVPDSLDQVWYVRNKVDVPLINTIWIAHSVGDVFIRVRGSVHSKKFPVD